MDRDKVDYPTIDEYLESRAKILLHLKTLSAALRRIFGNMIFEENCLLFFTSNKPTIYDFATRVISRIKQDLASISGAFRKLSESEPARK